jgi:hypothetical protein
MSDDCYSVDMVETPDVDYVEYNEYAKLLAELGETEGKE